MDDAKHKAASVGDELRAAGGLVPGAARSVSRRTGVPEANPSTRSLRISQSGISSSMVTVRSPPNISSGSALKLPESQRMTQSRVWLTVWMEPANVTPSSGQCST